MTDKILKLGEVDFNKPKDIYYLYADKEQMLANIKALAGEDTVTRIMCSDVCMK